MSLPIAQITCTGCDFRAPVHPTIVTLEYLLDDGSRIQAGRRVGWCYSCNTIVEIEDADAKELAVDIKNAEDSLRIHLDLQSQDPSHLIESFPISRIIEWDQNDLENARKFASIIAERKSPARCMSCWGTETKLLRFNEDGVCDDFQHSCGGQLEHHCGEGLRIRYKETRFLLDMEGRPLELEGWWHTDPPNYTKVIKAKNYNS